MTMTTPTVGVPPIETRHRLRIALEWANVSVGEMAELLGVNRNTPSNYLNGHTEPSVATLRVWAMRCGVPYEWLLYGDITNDDPEGGDPVTHPVTRRELAPFALAIAA